MKINPRDSNKIIIIIHQQKQRIAATHPKVSTRQHYFRQTTRSLEGSLRALQSQSVSPSLSLNLPSANCQTYARTLQTPLCIFFQIIVSICPQKYYRNRSHGIVIVSRSYYTTNNNDNDNNDNNNSDRHCGTKQHCHTLQYTIYIEL